LPRRLPTLAGYRCRATRLDDPTIARCTATAEVRKAQRQVARFNALAGAAAPETAKMDPGHVVRLQNLQEVQEAGLLSGEEYPAKRAEIIASL
jgi:hypothetical protein